MMGQAVKATCLISGVHFYNLFFNVPSFVLDTPKHTGSHQTAGSVPTSRESHPSVVLTKPPSLRDPAAKQGCDWTGVSLSLLLIVALSGAARYLQPEVTRSPRGRKKHRPIGNVKSASPYPADRGATADVAYAHHNGKRNVFDEWLFGCQGSVKVVPGKSFHLP